MGTEPWRANVEHTGPARTKNDDLASGPPLALVVFVLDGTHYAVPLEGAERAFRMPSVSPLHGAPPMVMGAINLHGSVVPVVDLHSRLGLPPREYGLGAHLLIVHTPRRKLAIPTDEVLGVREVASGSVALTRALVPGLHAVAGIAALPEGLLFIHDLEAFLSADEERSLDQALEAT